MKVPCEAFGAGEPQGILRLRLRFASQSTASAQDDKSLLAYFGKANPEFCGELQARLRENCGRCIFLPE